MKLEIIYHETHASKRWQHPVNFGFAGNETSLGLVGLEIGKALLYYPIAFLEHMDAFVPIAVLGLKPMQNLFVAPDGRWLAPYVPAAIQCYPFHLANGDGGKKVLCIDTDSGLESDESGEPFFGEDGAPTPKVREILSYLTRAERSRVATATACAALRAHKVIVPWPIAVKGDEGEQTLNGLYRIDEAAFNQLEPAALHELMRAGALPIAYCQLLSMQHLPVLGKLAQARALAQAQVQAAPINVNGSLDLEWLSKDGLISLSGI